MINTFWLDGRSAADYGIFMRSAPQDVAPKRDVTTKSVAGLNGDLQLDNGRYKNVSITLSCGIIPPRGVEYRDGVAAALAFLRSTAGYHRLQTTYDRGRFRMARVLGDFSVESIMDEAGEFDVEFDCKPQRWLLAGEQPVIFTESGALYNPTTEEARPVITMEGSGAGTVTIGARTLAVTFPDGEEAGSITLDCERGIATSGGTAANQRIACKVFPTLAAGENRVSFSGGVKRLSVEPRWWTI